MQKSFTTNASVNDSLTGNLFLLAMDSTGNPVGLVPMPVATARVDSAPTPGLSKSEGGMSSTESMRGQVERALRHLHDPMFLAEHPLADLRITRARLMAFGQPTCLDRGKAVSAMLTQIIEQLRPTGTLPPRITIPRREWHPYLILHCSYVEGEHNALIARWLQISEGTFNRTRRRALQSLAQVLLDLERNSK